MNMTEHRINGSRLVHAPTRLELGKELYASHRLDDAYELVYNLFPGISVNIIEQILNGTIKSYLYHEHNFVLVFFTEEQLNE